LPPPSPRALRGPTTTITATITNATAAFSISEIKSGFESKRSTSLFHSQTETLLAGKKLHFNDTRSRTKCELKGAEPKVAHNIGCRGQEKSFR
jgi:hypothetical protein